eukprot:Skav222068  [mRNA]  locus=scaffold707:305018:307029:- [translate_table: standard]
MQGSLHGRFDVRHVPRGQHQHVASAQLDTATLRVDQLGLVVDGYVKDSILGWICANGFKGVALVNCSINAACKASVNTAAVIPSKFVLLLPLAATT